jgi:hypothetical protein
MAFRYNSTSDGTELFGYAGGRLTTVLNAKVALTWNSDGYIGISTEAPTTDLTFGKNSSGVRKIMIERTTATGMLAWGTPLHVVAGGATSGQSDKSGGELRLSGGISVGTGTSFVSFYTATAGASGTGDNNPTEKMRITGNGFVGFNRTTATYPIHVGGNTGNGNGAYLSAAGTWTNSSSRSFKDRFENLNSEDILNKIEHLEINGWYYKETNEYHIWPFAEDFYTAFGTGDKNNKDVQKYLAAGDVAGVGLYAVQQLIRQNKQQQQQINSLLIENAALKTKTEEIDLLKAEIEQIKRQINTNSSQK